MSHDSRRMFLSDVGKGMIVAGIGTGLATDLGISTAFADDEPKPLTFGSLEPLVDLLQQTPVEKLQPALVDKISKGTPLKTLVAAGALANARRFGGQDYIGYHTLMALMPAWRISEELPSHQQALPILKVLYRNTARMQDVGNSPRLKYLKSKKKLDAATGEQQLYRNMCDGDMRAAESTFAACMNGKPSEAFDQIQKIVRDEPDVHRVTLAWRAWDVLQLAGFEHAHTLLRQSVRHCVDRERQRLSKNRQVPPLRKLVPKLLDEYKLMGAKIGTRRADAEWVDRLAKTFYSGTRAQAAEAAAGALADGFSPEDIGEAMSLAGNMLVLHDPGRRRAASADKPRDSVHGASVGVHASDSANSWRSIARITNNRNSICSLIVGAWHTAGQTGASLDSPFPFDVQEIQSKKLNADQLISELKDSVQSKDQARAMAVVKSWETAGYSAKPVFDCLRQYAISEDGALHAEKYYRTVTEEFPITRKEFRWRHLIGLARVSASEFGWTAPGREQALELLS